MAAPTNAASVKILLANSEPSTHGGIATVGEERLPYVIPTAENS